MTIRPIRRFVRRNRAILAVALVAALTSSGTTVAASHFFLLATINTASATTTLQTAANAAALALQNTNPSGGASAHGLSIQVPAGRPPITVNPGAGTATNLDADTLDGIDSTGFIRGPVEAWHEVGAAGEPAWSRITWTSYPGFETVAFMTDPFGFVHLKGRAIQAVRDLGACDAMTLFRLPDGYRPAAEVSEPALANDQLARVDILPTGYLAICFPTFFDTYDWISLDGITFRAAQ